MVLLTTTPFIISTISSLSSSSLQSVPSLPQSIDNPIDHKTLIRISRLTKSTAKPCTLNELLQGANPYHPPPPPKPQPSPEYLALKKKLLEQQEQREYANLVNQSVDELGEPEGQDDITPSLVFNIFLSVVLCAGAVFYLTRYWNNDAVRVLLSLLVGIVVGVAEVGVYAGYLRKVEMSRTKERRKKERKVFIGEYSGPDETTILTAPISAQEKEEIWGRGINGGMRRRVREKWEKEQEDDQD